jgi:hypothetical protein
MEKRTALVDEAIRDIHTARDAARMASEKLADHPEYAREARDIAERLSYFGKKLWSV